MKKTLPFLFWKTFLFSTFWLMLFALNASACGSGGEINVANARRDTLCMGESAQLFLQSYDGVILRWERSEDEGATWQPENRSERQFITEPLFRATVFRAVVKKGNCTEVFSKVRRVMPIQMTPRLIGDLDEFCSQWGNLNLDARVFGRDSIRVKFFVKTEHETEWFNDYDSTYRNGLPNNLNRRVSLRQGPWLPNTKNTLDFWYKAVVINSCGQWVSDSVKITYSFQFNDRIGKSKESYCIGDELKVWLNKYPNESEISWTGINVVLNPRRTKILFNMEDDPLDCSRTGYNSWDCTRYSIGGVYSNSDTLLIGYQSQKENEQQPDSGVGWDEKMFDESFLDLCKQKYGNDLKMSLFPSIFVSGNNCTSGLIHGKRIDIPVSLPSMGGKIKSNTYLCVGDAAPKLTLKDHLGKVLFWESSGDGNTWSRIAHTDTVYQPQALTQTTYFRAQVQNGNCTVRPSKFARIAFSPLTKAGILVGKNSRCPLDETPTITLRGQVGQVDHWETSFDGINWTKVPHIATNYKPDTILQDMWFRAVVISPGCNPVTTDAHKVSYLSALTFDVPKIKGPQWVCRSDKYINLELPADESMVVEWEVNDCCARPAFWEKMNKSGKNKVSYAFIKNCDNCCWAKQTFWFRVKLRYSLLCNDVYTIDFPVEVHCCPVIIECRGGSRCEGGSGGGYCLDVTKCINPWLCVGEQVSLFPSAEGLRYFDRWEYAEVINDRWVWTRVPNSEPDYFSHPLTQNTCFRNVSVVNGREFFSNEICVRVLPNTRPGYVTQNRTVCQGENSDTLRVKDWLGEIKIWQSSVDSLHWTDIIHSDSIYQSLALQQTTWFRSVVRLCNAKCALDYSKPVKIKVLPFDSTKGGQAFSVYDTICVGGRPKIKLDGHRGDVIFWQEASPNDTLFANARRINVFDPELEADPINANKIYRACVKNSDCETKFSKHALVKVGNPKTFAEFFDGAKTCPGKKANISIKKRKGDIQRWEYEENGNWLPIDTKAENITTHNLTNDTRFRVVLKLPACNPEPSKPITVKIDAQPKGGDLTPDKLACITRDVYNNIVYPSATFELRNQVGEVRYWETSTNNGSSWTKITETANTLEVKNAQSKTLVRAVVSIGECDPVFSTVGTFTVKPETQAGTITAREITVCENAKTQLTLSGYTGSIVRWESSIYELFYNKVSIVSTSPVIETNPVTGPVFYRAVLSSDCGEVYSKFIQLTTYNYSYPGSITGNPIICSGKTTNLELQNYQGTIVRWEYSTAPNTWLPIAQTTAKITTAPITSETKFRAMVNNNNCGEKPSGEWTVKPFNQLKGGTLTPASQDICLENQPMAYQSFELTDYQGIIRYWQVSTDQGQTWTKVSNNPNPNYSNYFKTTTWVRAFVSLENCDSAFSTISNLNITPALKGGKIVATDKAVCKEMPFPVSLELIETQDQVLNWEKTTDVNCVSNWTPVFHTLNTFFAENLTQTTCFRAVVKSACAQKNSEFVKVEVFENPEVNGVSPTASLLCEGELVTLTANGVKGNIINWQTCEDGRTWKDIPRSGNLSINPILNKSAQFRVVVGLEGCGIVFSNPVFIEVRGKVQIGTLTAPQTLCRGKNASIKLEGNNKRIIRWESTANADWSNVEVIYSNRPTLEVEELYAVTYYRAVLEGCMPIQTLYSPVVKINVQPCVTCKTPEGLSVKSIKGELVELQWLRDLPQAAYELSYRPVNEIQWRVMPRTTNVTQEISGLTSCQKYEARVRSICGQVFTDYSPSVFFTPAKQPATPTVTNITTSSAMINWVNVNGGTTVSQLRFRIKGNNTWSQTNTIQGQNSRMLIGLRNKTTYEVQIRSACNVNQILPDWTDNTVLFTTGTQVILCTERKPDAPANVSIVKAEARYASVKWQNIADSKGTAILYGLSNESPSKWKQVLVCAPTNSLVINGLLPGKTYRIRIRTLCETCLTHGGTDKKSDWSPVLDFTTPIAREESSIITEHTITVFPNPNKGIFNIRLDEAYTGNHLNLELYSLSGQLVWQENNREISGEIPVELSGIAAGTYLLKLNFENEYRFVKVVIE